MNAAPYISAAKAQNLLVDFACLLHVRKEEIIELRDSAVSNHRILSLYPFDASDYEFAIKCQMDDSELAAEVRRVSYHLQPYGTVARYLPVHERKLARARARAYDAELERLREFAKQWQMAVVPLEEHAQSVYEVLLALALLDCLTRQPYSLSINWTEDEQEALYLGLPAWGHSLQALLPKIKRRAEILSDR